MHPLRLTNKQNFRLENFDFSPRNSNRSKLLILNLDTIFLINKNKNKSIFFFLNPCCTARRHNCRRISTVHRRGRGYFTSFSRGGRRWRRCEAINQFFHSRRRMPWRWRFLLRYVIRPVLKGGSKTKCLGGRCQGLGGERCYIIRATVLNHFLDPPPLFFFFFSLPA